MKLIMIQNFKYKKMLSYYSEYKKIQKVQIQRF